MITSSQVENRSKKVFITKCAFVIPIDLHIFIATELTGIIVNLQVSDFGLKNRAVFVHRLHE